MDEKEIVFNRAKNAMLSRDFTLAARLFKSLLADDPNNLELLNSLGQLYIKASDDEKALPFYEQIIKLNPVNVDAYNNMGGIYRRLKRYDESIAILNKALSFNKNNSEVKYNLGFTYKLMGKNDEACDCFEYVISENPNDVLAYNHLGSIYATKKDYQKSISIYKRGLQIDPNHPILQYNLARSYVAINSDLDAFKAFEAALRAKPSWKDAVKEYSALLNKYSRTKESCEVIQKAINLFNTLKNAATTTNTRAINPPKASSMKLISPNSATYQIIKPMPAIDTSKLNNGIVYKACFIISEGPLWKNFLPSIFASKSWSGCRSSESALVWVLPFKVFILSKISFLKPMAISSLNTIDTSVSLAVVKLFVSILIL